MTFKINLKVKKLKWQILKLIDWIKFKSYLLLKFNINKPGSSLKNPPASEDSPSILLIMNNIAFTW